MANVAQLLQAIAAVLWPIFAFVALFVFRGQISQLLYRIKKGKVLGQEIELNESLIRLDRSAVKIESEVAALPPPVTPNPEKVAEAADQTIQRVVADAARSPKAALLMLASEVEKVARQVLASAGLLKGRAYVPLSQAIQELDKQYGGLPRHVSEALKLFWEVRNRLIHGAEASEQDILRAIDSGITILKALQALPQEINIVYHPGVEIYSDPEAKTKIEGARGVMLETIGPGNRRLRLSIFPTTRTHFIKGRRVAWEWNSENRWAAAWYRSPETNEIKPGWSSALEFVGRHMDEV